MAEVPDDGELERLGLYFPKLPGAEEQRQLLHKLFGMGATVEEVAAAAHLQSLGSLALDLATRGPGPSTPVADFADQSGLDPRLIRRLWVALGLPEEGDVPLGVNEATGEALRLMVGTAGILGEDAALALARVVGSSVARMAEALSDSFRVATEMPALAAGVSYAEVVEGYTEFTRAGLPGFLAAVSAVFQRHLVLASYQHWAADEAGTAVTRELVVGFADLVGSTDVLRERSVVGLAELIDRFEAEAWDLVTHASGRVVKVIGDEVMFVIEDPDRACSVGLQLAEATVHPVRVGLAHGAMVALHGDYYGGAVNLAARLVRAAEPASALVSDAVRHRAGPAFAFEPVELGAFKGFDEPVPAYRLGRTGVSSRPVSSDG